MSASPPRLLLVEDDLDLRKELLDALGSVGLEAEVAEKAARLNAPTPAPAPASAAGPSGAAAGEGSGEGTGASADEVASLLDRFNMSG